MQDINFGDCLLRTDGAYMFAEALSDNHLQLEIVDLSSNDMNSDAALALTSAMKNKPNLKKLNLDGNCFGDESAQRLRDAMKEALCPDALTEFEDLEGSDAADDEDEDGAETDENATDDGENDDYEGEEEEDLYDEYEDDDGHHNDSTEEAEEDDEGEGGYDEDYMYIAKPTFQQTKVT